jgi:hypothetical protein
MRHCETYATDVANFDAWCAKHSFEAYAGDTGSGRRLPRAAGERLRDVDAAPSGPRHRAGLHPKVKG